MPGSRASDSVRDPFYFSPLLFFIVTSLIGLPKKWQRCPQQPSCHTPTVRSPQRKESYASQVSQKRFRAESHWAINLPVPEHGVGMEWADWPNLKHLPTPRQSRWGHRGAFPEGIDMVARGRKRCWVATTANAQEAPPRHAMQIWSEKPHKLLRV